MARSGPSRPVELHCPQCDRFLAEADHFGRSVCADCGWEVTVRSRDARKEVVRRRPS